MDTRRLRIGFGPTIAQADAESTRNSYTHPVGKYPLQASDRNGKWHMDNANTLKGNHHAVHPFRGGLHGRGTEIQAQQSVDLSGLLKHQAARRTPFTSDQRSN